MKHFIKALLILMLPAINAFSQEFNKAKMDSLFKTLSVNNKVMGSVAISKNGKLIYSNAIGFASINGTEKIPASTATRYRIGSISKMFTAVLIFQLIEEKQLSLDDKLDKFFPSLPNASKISIGNLLNHHSGLHNFTNDSLYLTYYLRPHSQKEMLDIMAASPVDFEPGAKGEYSNSNFLILGYIAEKISKLSYRELIQKKIASKLKLADTYVGEKINTKNKESYSYTYISDWKQEPETDMSVPEGAGAIVSTPGDLVKFIEGLLAGKLISQNSIEQMKTLKDGYGMGILPIPFYEKKALGHNGGIDGFVSNLSYFPKDSVAFAYCSNGEVYQMNNILIGMLSIYFNRPYSIPSFTSITLTTNELDKYVGTYASKQIPLKITVSRDQLVLLAQATGQQSFPLEAMGKDSFKFDRAGIVMEFNPEKKEFTLKQGGGTYLFTQE